MFSSKLNEKIDKSLFEFFLKQIFSQDIFILKYKFLFKICGSIQYIALPKRWFWDVKGFSYVSTVAGHEFFVFKPGLLDLAWDGGLHHGDRRFVLQLGEW